jgi:hypothetical protein
VNSHDLRRLNTAVEHLAGQQAFVVKVERLKAELAHTNEPFVWATVALDSIPCELPAIIKSCWIFHLKKDVPSGCHYHPNSIQHMVSLNGWGTSNVGGKRRRIIPLASPEHSLAEKWYVIPRNEPHEFMPEHEDMTVVSFHTCPETELEEVACETGKVRRYGAVIS